MRETQKFDEGTKVVIITPGYVYVPPEVQVLTYLYFSGVEYRHNRSLMQDHFSRWVAVELTEDGRETLRRRLKPNEMKLLKDNEQEYVFNVHETIPRGVEPTYEDVHDSPYGKVVQEYIALYHKATDSS